VLEEIIVFAALLLAGCLVAQPATVAEEKTPVSKEQIRQLVQQLDSRELALREAAEKQLVELGPDVLSLLPEPNNRMPAEMRQRLLRIKSALETTAAEVSVNASLVTLAGEMTLPEALQALSEQTGNQIAGVPAGRDTKVTVDFQQTPFWKALDGILDQEQLRPDPFGGRPNTLVLVARPPEEQSRAESGAHYAGPFRVEAIRVTAVRDLRNPNVQGLRVTTSIGWEPRLTPIVLSQATSTLEVVDDQGRTIDAGTEGGNREVPIHPGMTGVEFDLPLTLPDRSAVKIASFKGSVVALIPSSAETFVFDNLEKARAVEQKHAGATVILDEVRKNLQVLQIRVRLRFDEASGALESHRGWVTSNEAYLLDPAGQRIDHAGLETTRQSSNEVGVGYLFDREEGVAGCKFVYKTPSRIIRLETPYELVDLPLP
jgi:hypothetical protein